MSSGAYMEEDALGEFLKEVTKMSKPELVNFLHGRAP